MKTLVKHLVNNNIGEIVDKSFLNCHCKGLHSIMLLESPGKTIRLYVSEADSDMQHNLPENNSDILTLSLAFHPHHCNLTLDVVKGSIVNWVVRQQPFDCEPHPLRLDKWIYGSAIKGEKMTFKRKKGKDFLFTWDIEVLPEGQSTSMTARAIHTVGCYPGEVSAWLVYEGKEDTDYIPYCWSNSDLNHIDTMGLYVKPTRAQVMDVLDMAGLI